MPRTSALPFELVSSFKPTGDQPRAIKELSRGLQEHKRFQTLLGATGSGKTFTLACVIEQINSPVLVISHNKTLAGQLYSELKEFFPHNAVEYFVSYYDYYQPESYIPHTDTYIEKDAAINEKLDVLRLSSTSSLVSRRDVIVVASVSCIYNLGSPKEYQNLTAHVCVGEAVSRQQFIQQLVSLHYERNDTDFKRSTFRVKGDTVDVFPSYKDRGVRVIFFGDTIESLFEIHPVSAATLCAFEKVVLYPAKHFVMNPEKLDPALISIEKELGERVSELRAQGKAVEAQRLESRTRYDMEMLKEMGYCHGIENYSRHISGLSPGSRPYCLLDYFPSEFITIIDESHVTLPQIRGMFEGDKSRKTTLVNFGFRLPSCLDNRPLMFDEFMRSTGRMIFVSATPQDYEISLSGGSHVEQIIRPTGLIDPRIEVRPTRNQIDSIITEVAQRARNNQRTLITTLTKRMCEELSGYLQEEHIQTTWLHSELNAFERAKIIKELRQKKFDCVVGVNLLREGIDIPEVSLVVILDADKEGFLRSTTSLIQLAGRCARHVDGHVIMFADHVTRSMKSAISESRRRRAKQLAYNRKHHITPVSIQKSIKEGIETYAANDAGLQQQLGISIQEKERIEIINQLEKEMCIAAEHLQFEKAAALRDTITELQREHENTTHTSS